MALVEVTEQLNSSAHDVWDLIRDVEAYPRLMVPVRSIDVLDEKTLPSGLVEIRTAWEVELKGSILCWEELETRDDENMRVEYVQLSGDMERFEGFWQVTSDGEGCTATLNVEFEIGIPILRDMLEPIAIKALRSNSVMMLRSLDNEPSNA